MCAALTAAARATATLPAPSTAPATAQAAFPNNPVTIIVGFPAGGPLAKLDRD